MVLSRSFVSGQPTFKDVTPAGNCDGADFTRQTSCISATGQAAVRQACQSLCMKSQTNTTAIDKRCRGFSFIDRAAITVDFQNCKQNGKSRCDLFFGCSTITATKKVTDKMTCVASAGVPDCPTTTTTATPVVSDGSLIDQAKKRFMGLLTPEGPTVMGWVVFGSAAGVLLIIIIVIIACCCCCCNKNKQDTSGRRPRSYSNMARDKY